MLIFTAHLVIKGVLRRYERHSTCKIHEADLYIKPVENLITVRLYIETIYYGIYIPSSQHIKPYLAELCFFDEI